jgi:hypothetical protein
MCIKPAGSRRRVFLLRRPALAGSAGPIWMLVCHSPSAILSLPAFVSRSPPDNSCMYPSWISRTLCSAGIAWCVKPLAQCCNEANSSWVNGGADKPCAITQICAPDSPFSSEQSCHNQTDQIPKMAIPIWRLPGTGSGVGLA